MIAYERYLHDGSLSTHISLQQTTNFPCYLRIKRTYLENLIFKWEKLFFWYSRNVSIEFSSDNLYWNIRCLNITLSSLYCWLVSCRWKLILQCCCSHSFIYVNSFFIVPWGAKDLNTCSQYVMDLCSQQLSSGSRRCWYSCLKSWSSPAWLSSSYHFCPRRGLCVCVCVCVSCKNLILIYY